MIPHERSLVTEMKGKPFAIVGINTDSAEMYAEWQKKLPTTWRSFADGDPEGPICKRWCIGGFPTVFVLDGEGVIRHIDPDDLDQAVKELVEAAGRAPSGATAQDSAPASRPAGPGGLVAFTRGGNVWVVDAGGGNERQLTTGQAYDRPLTWTPDGARVVYWKHPEDWHLWAVDVATGVQTDLTPDGGDCRSLKPSPDGRLAAFMSGRDGLSLMNADGSKRRVLTKLGHRDAPPAWSPDGTRLAFTHLRQGGEHQVALDIHLIGLEPAEPPPFVTGAFDAAWSRDGRTLLYLAYRGSPTADLCAMDPATKGEKNLTSTPDLNESAFAVSPDGRRIAVVSYDAGWESPALRVLDADGSNAKELVKLVGRPALPSWSPDSKRIAISQGPQGKADVWTIDAASGQATQLTKAGGEWAVWQPR
jgi:TolB protein